MNTDAYNAQASVLGSRENSNGNGGCSTGYSKPMQLTSQDSMRTPEPSTAKPERAKDQVIRNTSAHSNMLAFLAPRITRRTYGVNGVKAPKMALWLYIGEDENSNGTGIAHIPG